MSATDPIIICGMARSGTTYLSRKLHASGIEMWDWEMTHGEDADIWGWISAEFTNNGPVVSQIPAAYDPSDSFVTRLKFYGQMRDQALDGKRWGLKEPRISHVAKAFHYAYPDAKWVICLRNPVACVLSQKQRKDLQNFEMVSALQEQAWRTVNIFCNARGLGLNMHVYCYDADMKAEQDALNAFLETELDLSDFTWKQVSRGDDYTPSDMAPEVEVTRVSDFKKLSNFRTQ